MPCNLPFRYWVFGRPISIGNEEDGVPRGLAGWKRKINKIVEIEVASLTDGRGCELIDDRVGIRLVWLSPDPHALDKPDLDNIVKPFIDALSQRVIKDDRQVDRILAERVDVNSPPCSVVDPMHEILGDPDFGGEVTIVFLEALERG